MKIVMVPWETVIYGQYDYNTGTMTSVMEWWYDGEWDDTEYDGHLWTVGYYTDAFDDPIETVEFWVYPEDFSKEEEERNNTMKWQNTDIDVVEIDGALYALNGWNGEKYLHCWKCIDRFTADPDGAEYEIAPVYDWDNYDALAGEFITGDGSGIIGYEVL